MGGTEEAHTSADARSTTVIVRGFALELPKATPPRSPRTRLANGVHPPAVSYSKKGHSPSSSLGKGRDLDDGLEPFLSDGECAISDSSIGDDDDSSDWESSSDEGAQQFPRVRPEIVSRGSLLTSSLDRHQGAAASAQAAARSGPAMQRSRITSTNDASPTSSVEMSSNYGGGPAISQAVPNRIPGTTTDSLLLSPEWTESLRSACKHEQRSSSYTNEAKVTDRMRNEQLANEVERKEPIDASQSIVSGAREAGSKDDITCMVVSIKGVQRVIRENVAAASIGNRKLFKHPFEQ